MTASIPKGQLFIDGVWRDSADGATRLMFNPATEAPITAIVQAQYRCASSTQDIEPGKRARMYLHGCASFGSTLTTSLTLRCPSMA